MPRPGESVIIHKFGGIAGSVAHKALPSLKCSWVKLKACSDNAGSVYLGRDGVVKAHDADDTAVGFELDAGDETDWLPLETNDMSELYIICDNAGDALTYMTLI